MLLNISYLYYSLFFRTPYVFVVANKLYEWKINRIFWIYINKIICQLVDIWEFIDRIIVSFQAFTHPGHYLTWPTYQGKLVIGSIYIIYNQTKRVLDICNLFYLYNNLHTLYVTFLSCLKRPKPYIDYKHFLLCENIIIFSWGNMLNTNNIGI